MGREEPEWATPSFGAVQLPAAIAFAYYAYDVSGCRVRADAEWTDDVALQVLVGLMTNKK